MSNNNFRSVWSQRPPFAVIAIWAALILGLIIFLFWVREYSQQREAARSHLVYSTQTTADRDAIATCLSDGLPLTERGWTIQAGGNWRRDNSARHLSVAILDKKDRRSVAFFTRDGRPLREHERAVVSRCLLVSQSK